MARAPGNGEPARRATILAVVLIIPVLSCASDVFNKARASFVAALARLPKAIRPEAQLAGGLCEARSPLDFLQHRVEGSRAYRWDAEPQWGDRSRKRLRDPKRPELGTWAAHCGRMVAGIGEASAELRDACRRLQSATDRSNGAKNVIGAAGRIVALAASATARLA